MSIRLQLPKVTDLKPRITVVGVGGAGGNAINNMIAAGLTGVNFVVANTDAQALSLSSAEHRIQLGTNLTEGMGAGSKPEIGEAAAEEAVDDIRAQVAGSHMLFIAAGMGGGTGTGAASVIARVARELGILTVAVVTKPFLFEGARRLRIAEAGVAHLKTAVDTLIVIPNQNLFRISTEKTTFAEAFVLADQVLYSGIACIVDLIIKEGLINLDLADVKTVLQGMGGAMMGTGEASGEDRARLAAEEAINNPLLDDISLRGARGLLVSIIGGHDLTLYEVDAAAMRVRQEVDPDANIIVGATFDDSLGDRVRVSIVASGMAQSQSIGLTQNNNPAPPPFMIRPTAASVPKPGAAGSVAGAAAKTPPPLPASPRKFDDLERRLAGAAEPGSGYASQFDGQILSQGGRRDAAAPAWKGGTVEPTRRIGAVTVEERAPQLPGPIAAASASPAVVRNESGYDPALDKIAGPTSGQRHSSRMPELADFPPIAQHEYRARSEAYAATSTSQRPPNAYINPANLERKKPSIFQRLTGAGRARKANAADDAPLEVDALPGFLARNKR